MKFYLVVVLAVAMANAILSKVDGQSSSLSGQCASENTALASSSALKAAKPYAECTIYLDVNDKCTADFEPLSDDFKDACFLAGGQFYTTDMKFDCTTLLYGVRYNADYTYLSFPACFGTSCSDSELNEYYEKYVHPALEETFAAQGFTCQVTDTNDNTEDANDKNAGLKSGTRNSSSDAGSLLRFNIAHCIMLLQSIILAVVIALW
jgi:hypothetical protein